MMTSQRRYDIDWLRVIAIGLLLIYHIAIGFQPWGVFIGFIQNSDSMEWIWIPMSMLNVWRIPLLFFVSGMGVCFAISRRNWKELLLERSKRILLPFIFGVLTIVPLQMYLWQNYYSQEMKFMFNPAHLWFLGNIFFYVLLLSPLFFYIKNNPGSTFNRWLKTLFGSPVGLLVIVSFFVLEALLVDPDMFEMYAMTDHGFWLGLLAFFFGFCLVYSGEAFWQMAKAWKWVFLGSGLVLYLVRVLAYELEGVPNVLMAVESNLWIFGMFGLAYHYLNRPGKALSYLSQAAYPIYIIHMIFLYLASFFFFEMTMPVGLKLILVIVVTFIGCFFTYEFLIRRVKFIRPLFGLKLNPVKRLL